MLWLCACAVCLLFDDLQSKKKKTRETRNTMHVRLTTILAHPLKVLSKHS